MNKKNHVAVIVATGPSANLIDFNKFKDFDLYTVSNGALVKGIDHQSIRAQYFAPYHPPLEINNYLQWIRMIDDYLPAGTAIMTSKKNYKKLQLNNIIPDRKIIQVNIYNKIIYKLLRFNKYAIPHCASGVLQLCYLIIKMRYREIILVGCDQNSLINFNQDIDHCFKCDTIDPRKHASDASVWPSITESLEAELAAFKEFNALADIAKSLNIKIINASCNSWIDSFPKTSEYNKVAI